MGHPQRCAGTTLPVGGRSLMPDVLVGGGWVSVIPGRFAMTLKRLRIHLPKQIWVKIYIYIHTYDYIGD